MTAFGPTDTEILARRKASMDILDEIKGDLEANGAWIDPEKWKKAGGSIRARLDVLEKAADPIVREVRVDGLGQPTAPAISTEDQIAEAYERGRREANPEATRDRIREGARNGDVVIVHRNGQSVPYSFGAAPAKEPDPYHDAFRAWLAGGERRMSDAHRDVLRTGFTEFNDRELRALGEASGAIGGYLVPTELQNRIVMKLTSYSGILESGRATVLNTKDGRPISIPVDDDTSNYGEIVAENADVGMITDPAFTAKTVGAKTYSSKPLRVSFQLLSDSGIDGLENWIVDLLAARIGRRLAQHLVNGDPAASPAQPEGFLKNITTGITTASPTAVTYDELVDMTLSVDQAYQANAAWLAGPSFRGLVGKLKDTAGNPIWSDARGGMPAELLGYPVVRDANMPTVAATTKPAVFGDLSSFLIRRAGNMIALRLAERYAEYGQIGFLLFARYDSLPLVAGAFKALVMHA